MPEIKNVCEIIHRRSKEIVSDNCIPIFLGGDHSIAIATIGGVAHNHRTGLIWIDHMVILILLIQQLQEVSMAWL
jgi:arginase